MKKIAAVSFLNARPLTWERLIETIAPRARPALADYLNWRLSLIAPPRSGV